MKITLPNLLIFIYAKWCSSYSFEKRANLFIKFIRSASRAHQTLEELIFLMELENYLYAEQQKAAVNYGNGIHPKHRLVNYQKFFIDNLNPKENIIDIGNGNGFINHELVLKVPVFRKMQPGISPIKNLMLSFFLMYWNTLKIRSIF